jgi:starvation-inducible DNA-binding protein
VHKTSIKIPQETRQAIVTLLNKRLADAIDLGIQAKLAHWNVRGVHFIGLHELFDKVADMANEHADELAERLAQLGGVAKATLQETARTSSLPKANSNASDAKQIITSLSKAIAAFSNAARGDIETTDDMDDEVTSDIMTRICGEADKMLWFVEAHLQ